MKYNPEKREIILNRELSKLDKFVIDFASVLKDDYVIVSGYVSIVFGRSRATEDIDFLIKKMNFSDFEKVWDKIEEAGFECINTSSVKEAHDMLNEFAIRFARKGKAIPNIEFKFIKNELDKYSFSNRIKVWLAKKTIYISDLEMQISYKRYYLGSEKDIEDALHLEKLFEEKIDKEKINKLKKLILDVKRNEKRKRIYGAWKEQ